MSTFVTISTNSCIEVGHVIINTGDQRDKFLSDFTND